MSGIWRGEYGYSDRADTVPFTVWLEDSVASFSGTTLEPNTFAPTAAEELSAEISGNRTGLAFNFSKIYVTPLGFIQPPVLYSGQVSLDFASATGTWNFPPGIDYRGHFRLTRLSRNLLNAIERRARLTEFLFC